jgi:hypothetical protein
MAAVAAGRRTSSAFPSFVARYGYDVLLESLRPLPAVVALPQVRGAVELPGFLDSTTSVGGTSVPADDVTFLGLPARPAWPLVKLVAGHLPVASQPSEVLASLTTEQFGVHVGSIITMPMYASSQRDELSAASGTISPRGPTLHLAVVGIEADAADFPSGAPMFTLFAGPALERTLGPHLLQATATLVRLRHGASDVSDFSAQFEHLSAGVGYAENVDDLEATVQQSITPQVTGWDLLALLAALAALAVVGQAFGRQSVAQAESYPMLRALGLRPGELFRLGVFTAASIGALGAVGAVALAWALSPLTPVGVARIAAPSTGLAFDPLVLGVGALGVVALCAALGAVAAWRSSSAVDERRRLERPRARSSSVLAPWRAGAGALPSALVGTRRALQRGTGGATLPVGTALVGSSLAVTALVATAVFGAGLPNLTRSPALYGQVQQLTLANGLTGAQVQSILPALRAKRPIDRITYGVLGPFLGIRGLSVATVLVDDVEGPLNFAVASGHLPNGDGQIALGSSTLRQVGAHVGSVIPVTIATPLASRTAQFRVVGTSAFGPAMHTGGIALALFGAATVTHLLVASVTRRRRDIALLKALGFVRRQVAAAVCWQATTIAVVAVGFGVPVGIALGRVVWRTFASNLGAVPVDVVPVWLVIGLAAGVLVAVNLLAGLPAVGAARLRPSEALRQA